MDKFLFCKISLLTLGLRTSGLELPSVDRIVDGAFIDIKNVPYMLSYMVNDNHACGAAVINNEWGLTAAHCVIPFVDNPSVLISVRSGSNRHDAGGTIHNVTTFSYHEKYNDENNDYDIAVFKVHPPFDFNDKTQPIKLPESTAYVNTNWGLVAGWGYFIDSDPILSENLQYVIVPKVKKETCKQDYEDRYEITEHQVCYGFSQGGKDACKVSYTLC
ncbi:Trypsin-6 [Eufriesea mexicana]|uniref:Trypsin-6 n=1 Tax=Eufriesea mexicana TaxID=516756 RepID=A0A310S6T5_9HYME|nr:Trypsin-6 [Eufriesea mexicana]